MRGLIIILSILSWIQIEYAAVDPRVYRFAFSNDGHPANYVENGEIIGQSVDMVLEVCKFAGKTCRAAIVQRKHCWDSTNGFPPFSLVLNQKWYDCCANLPKSPERQLNYIFPKQTFYLTAKQSLLVHEKSTITANALFECNNFTLAYPANTALDPDCLLDLGYFVQQSNYVPVFVEGDLLTVMSTIIEMVRNKTVDLGLAITRFQGNRLNGVRPLDQQLAALECPNSISDGLNVMMRSDETDFVEWWDNALHKFLCSGKKYTEFCAHMRDKYKIDPLCREPGKDVDCKKFGGESIKKAHLPFLERINPCKSVECDFLEVSTFNNKFFTIHDNNGLKPRFALVGSKQRYKGPERKMVGLTLYAKDEQFFRMDKCCVTVNNARSIKFVFRGGDRENEEVDVPVNVKQVWSTHCARNKGSRDRVRLEIEPLKKGDGGKDEEIRVKDLELTACLD